MSQETNTVYEALRVRMQKGLGEVHRIYYPYDVTYPKRPQGRRPFYEFKAFGMEIGASLNVIVVTSQKPWFSTTFTWGHDWKDGCSLTMKYGPERDGHGGWIELMSQHGYAAQQKEEGWHLSQAMNLSATETLLPIIFAHQKGRMGSNHY